MKLIVCKYQYILFTSFILLSLNDWLIRCDLFHIQHIKQDNTNKQNSVHHYKSVFYDDNTEYHHQGHHEHGDENMDHVPVTFNNITNNTSTRPIVLLDENDSNFIINETLFNKLTKKFSSNQNISSRKLTKPKVLTNRIYSASSSRSTSTPPPTPIISVTKIIKNWPPNDYRIEFIEDLVQTQIGIKFLNDDENDFSQMIIMPKISSIYIVKKRGTILKVDMTSLEQLDKYTLPPSTKPISECNDSRSCHSIKEISLLSRMPDERMIWLCYVHHNPYDNHPNLQAESGCMVPTVENLAIPLVQWENPHFNSLYPDRPASVLNAADGFTYISAFTLEYLRIFRAYMPDWNGNFNWTGALVTDKSPTFIAEPAQILLTFETMNEIYFVLREQPNSPITKCGPQPENPINRLLPTEKLKLSQPTYCLTSVARLVRVCKGDPGGLPHISANRFATFAKADLICPATNKNGGYFSYTHISAAYWDNNTKLLYATFTTEKSAPTGSALCVYGLNEFKASFSGPLLRTNAIQNNMRSSPVPNSFSNICSRFNSKNKTDEEVTVGRRLSLRFPFRYLPVKPLHGHALLAQTGDIWLHLQAYNLPGLTSHYQQPEQVTTSIIWIGTKKRIIQFALYTHNDVKTSSMGKTYSTNDQDKPTTTIICKLKEIYLGRQIESFIYRIPSEEINSNRNENDAKRIRGMNLRPVHSSEETFKDSEGIFEREDKEIQHIEITASNLYIMTNRQLFRLPVTRCFEYKTFSECLQSKDPHCGWNWPEGRCSSGYLFDSTIQINRLSTFSPSVDHRQHSHHNQCPSESYTMNKNKDNSWTPWYDCSWINSQQIIDQIPITIDDHNDIDMNDNITDYIEMNQLGNCQCRVCISRTHCIFGMQQVKNCTRYDENWLPWSTWSSCDLINNIQVRQRQCRPNAICSGITMEQRSCLDDAVWFKQSNSIPKSAGYINPRVSFTGQTDGFTLTHLILVAICGLLTGSLLTIILFWICRRHRLSFNENAVIQSSSSKKHIKIISPHCANHLPCESEQTCLTTSEPLSYKSWSLIDEKEPVWCNKSDKTMATVVDTRYEYLPSSHITSVPDNRSNKSSNRKLVEVHCSNAPCYDIPTNTHLLCSSPSPTSMISSQSTGSTLLKDKFIYDSYLEQNLNLLQDDKNNLINITSDNRIENYNENLGKLYLTGYLYTPIEPVLHENITISTTKVTTMPTTKFNVKLPQHQQCEIKPTKIPSHIQTNSSLVIPQPLFIQPTYSPFIKAENNNNNSAFIATTVTTTKSITGQTLTITENPGHIS